MPLTESNLTDQWQRSDRGTLWTRLSDGRTVSVFKHDNGLFRWCIVTARQPRFSPGRGWPSERQAFRALLKELNDNT